MKVLLAVIWESAFLNDHECSGWIRFGDGLTASDLLVAKQRQETHYHRSADTEQHCENSRNLTVSTASNGYDHKDGGYQVQDGEQDIRDKSRHEAVNESAEPL